MNAEQIEEAKFVQAKNVRRVEAAIANAHRGIAACEEQIVDHGAQIKKLEAEKAELLAVRFEESTPAAE